MFGTIMCRLHREKWRRASIAPWRRVVFDEKRKPLCVRRRFGGIRNRTLKREKNNSARGRSRATEVKLVVQHPET